MNLMRGELVLRLPVGRFSAIKVLDLFLPLRREELAGLRAKGADIVSVQKRLVRLTNLESEVRLRY